MLRREHFVSKEKMFVYLKLLLGKSADLDCLYLPTQCSGPDLDMWRSQGIHWRNTACTHSGISCVSASLVRESNDDNDNDIKDENHDDTCGDS